MHEASLMRGLVKKVEEIARTGGAARVRSIRVKLGALSHISPEHFREHFQEAAVGSLAENAHLEFDVSSDIDDPHAQDVVVVSLGVEDADEDA